MPIYDDYTPPDQSPESWQEKADRLGVPLIGPLPEETDQMNPVVSVCGKCGLELRGIMAYYCTNQRCPTGLGSPTSMAYTNGQGLEVYYVAVERPGGGGGGAGPY